MEKEIWIILHFCLLISKIPFGINISKKTALKDSNWGFLSHLWLQIEGFLLFLRVRKILKYIKSYKLRVFEVWVYLEKQRRLGATTLLQRKRKEAPVHVGDSSFSWHRFIYRERGNKKNSFSSWKVADLS